MPKHLLLTQSRIDEKEDSNVFVEKLATYYEDWLLPELAESILKSILEDESSNISPHLKVTAFRILQTRHLKNIRFGTTLGELQHQTIVKHLNDLCTSTPPCKIEVSYIVDHAILNLML